MPKALNPEEQLASFLARYTPEIASFAEAVLGRMRKRYPHAAELVYDNYNAVAIGFGPTEKASEAIFSIAVFPRWVSLFFLQAKELQDPGQILRGNGKVARHIVLSSLNVLNDPAVIDLMQQAEKTAKVPFHLDGKHSLVIKSISPSQRPRRPAEKKMRPATKPSAPTKRTPRNG
jgi:hypothetical protein